MAANRPTQRDRELGSALCSARKTAGFNQTEAAKKLHLSQPTVSRIEEGKKRPAPDELTEMLDLYAPADRPRIEELACLAGGDEVQLDSNFAELLTVEETADVIRKFTSERIPTALQHERYTFKQHQLAGVPYEWTELARLRANRADLLKRENGPRYEVVMSYSSLLRMPGGDLDLMEEQASHLLELIADVPRLTVGVLMFDAKIPYVDTDFSIVAKDGRTAYAYTQSGRDGFRITDKAKIKERESYWNLVQQAALPVEETCDVLRALAEYGPNGLVAGGFRSQIG